MPEPIASPDRPTLGVVVIGRNEGDRLIRCLESLAGQDATIVYVDSASSDGSPEVAERRGAIVVPLDLSLPFTAARARNEGLAHLLANEPPTFVQFVDGDCEVETGWLSTAKAALQAAPSVAVVCGRRRERFPEASLYNALCDDEWNTPIGYADACGGDAMMRTAALRAVGGYDASLIAGEEPELCTRLRATGFRIQRIDAPMTIHDAAMTKLRQWWLRNVRGGFGYAQVWRTTRDRPISLYGSQVARALLWTLLPTALAILAALLWSPWALIGLPIIHIAQIARMALRHPTGKGSNRWARAALLHGAKFPETQGILRYIRQSLLNRRSGTIFYK